MDGERERGMEGGRDWAFLKTWIDQFLYVQQDGFLAKGAEKADFL